MQATSKQDPSMTLCAFYTSVRSYTEKLCEPLETEDYIPQPVIDASPPKWNIAHTTWFFEEMVLKNFVPDYKVFDENFSFLFNSYYNSIGDRTARDYRGAISRPTVKEVFEYRKYVDEKMADLLGDDVPAEVRDLVVLGLNHEQQHQELFLTDLKYTFSLNPLFPFYDSDLAFDESASGKGKFVEVRGGIHEIGHNGEGFCFDNELSRHKVYLEDFAISDRLVTNGEFIEFIDAGGYNDPMLWHSDGWDWVKQNDVVSPLYWHHDDSGWRHYTLAGLRDLPMDAPVTHVSYYEAAAFAEWKGCCLPTEFEWEIASSQLEWGQRWEWTNSAYLPYPGFKKAAGAVGEYNGKFMINQMVLRGASVVTPAGHSRPSYRNFFNPHLRWQFTGIRLVK
ncbi:MAG: ergothioneine biosynthesis protein EgtB [Chloracidobacterium sp.]|nr:ergothioneine biosynthesis protein EgtB [Chloracidobacterium sp.]